jgi:hypothetical protein
VATGPHALAAMAVAASLVAAAPVTWFWLQGRKEPVRLPLQTKFTPPSVESTVTLVSLPAPLECVNLKEPLWGGVFCVPAFQLDASACVRESGKQRVGGG